MSANKKTANIMNNREKNTELAIAESISNMVQLPLNNRINYVTNIYKKIQSKEVKVSTLFEKTVFKIIKLLKEKKREENQIITPINYSKYRKLEFSKKPSPNETLKSFGFIKTWVEPYGTCGYHAIMQSLKHQKNKKYNEIRYMYPNIEDSINSQQNKCKKAIGLNKIKNVSKDITFDDLPGYALRQYCADQLKKLKHKINTNRNSINGNWAKLNEYIIYLHGIGGGFSRNIKENNMESPQSLLSKIIQILESFEIAEEHDTWIEHYMFPIISILLNINIFIYENGRFNSVINTIPINSKNSAFIYYNGKNHYWTLEPIHGKNFKNSFNNLPNTDSFEYNFFKNNNI
jgi:hypothetical protein